MEKFNYCWSKPLAITNCLNFGNPENQEIMGEFAECLEGIKEACEFLNYPVFQEMYLFIMAQIKKILSHSSYRWSWFN